MLKLQTPVFRVSFPQVFEAKQVNNQGKAKFSMTMLFNTVEINKDPKEAEKFLKMQQACKLAASEKWPVKMPDKLKNPFRKGEEKEQYTGYGKGVIFASASSLTKPGLVDAQLNKIIDPEQFYAGCYARATVNFYAWSYLGNFGVGIGLQNIQKVKDGEPIGGRTLAENDFESLTELSEDVQSSSTDSIEAMFG